MSKTLTKQLEWKRKMRLGKIFTTFIVFIGLGLVAVPAGLLATAFSDTFKKD